MEKIEFLLPDWSLSYFINGDMESYSDEELELMKNFEKDLSEKYELVSSLQIEESAGFKHSNDISNLGADCSNVFYLVREKKV